MTQTATWVLAALAGFLLPPPDWSTPWEWLGRFLVAVVTGFVLVPIILFARKEQTWKWWIAALGCFVMGITSVLIYLDFRDDGWTTVCGGRRIVIGTTLNAEEVPRIERYIAKHHVYPDAHTIAENEGCDAEKIWNGDEIADRRHPLVWMYLGSLVLLTAGLMSLLQAIQCARDRQN